MKDWAEVHVRACCEGDVSRRRKNDERAEDSGRRPRCSSAPARESAVVPNASCSEARYFAGIVERFYDPLYEFTRIGLGLSYDKCEDIVSNALSACIVPAPLREAVQPNCLWCWHVAYVLHRAQEDRKSLLGHMDERSLEKFLEEIALPDVGDDPGKTLSKKAEEVDFLSKDEPVTSLRARSRTEKSAGRFNSLVDSRDDLVKIAVRIGFPVADAEDTVQRAILIAFGKPEVPIENAHAWFRRVLWNEIGQRSRAARKRKFVDIPGENPPVEFPQLSSSIDWNSDVTDVLRCLSAVESRVDRVSLWLTEAQDATYEEVRLITNAGHVNTVSNRCKRALEQIRADIASRR